MKLRILLASVAVLAMTTTSAFAAISLGAIGKVAKITRRTELTSYKVSIGIDEDGNGTADRFYYSGGAWCEGLPELTDSQVEALERAALNALDVGPGYTLGPSSARCMNHFSVSY